jgi:hypothetical protein
MGYSYFENAQLKLRATYSKIAYVQQLRQELQAELKNFSSAMLAAKLEYTAGDLQNATEIFNASLLSLKDFAAENLQDINSTITNGQETCVKVMSVTKSIDLTSEQWAVGLIMTIIPAMLLGCLWWRVYGKNNMAPEMNRCRTWFIFPLFVLMIMLSIISCGGVVIGTLMNSDFCSAGGDEYTFIGLTGPDVSVLNILLERGSNPRSLEFQAAAFLVNVRYFLLFDAWTMCRSQKPDSPVRTPSAEMPVVATCATRTTGNCDRHRKEN